MHDTAVDEISWRADIILTRILDIAGSWEIISPRERGELVKIARREAEAQVRDERRDEHS